MGHRPYLVYAYEFDEDSGGIIALYALAQRLRELGERVAIWPSRKPGLPPPFKLRSAAALFTYLANRPRYAPDVPGMDLPVAGWRDVEDAIFIYPETVAGNPKGAKRIVRWLLHRPGYWTGAADFGADDLFFFYQDAFDDARFNRDPTNRLTVSWMNPVYRRTNWGERSGACYLLRKGRNRATDIDRSQVVCVDGMSHAEKAATFNQHEYLVSYDLYSMFSVYAALCGCTPVVVPEPGLPRDRWFARPEDRLGLAYGWSEVEEARATRGALMEKLANYRAREDDMVRRFVAKSQAYFA